MIHGYSFQSFRSASLTTSINWARQFPENSKGGTQKRAITKSQGVGNDAFETHACLLECATRRAPINRHTYGVHTET